MKFRLSIEALETRENPSGPTPGVPGDPLPTPAPTSGPTQPPPAPVDPVVDPNQTGG
jgi:hypothetical protein